MDRLERKHRVPSHSLGLVINIHTALADRRTISIDLYSSTRNGGSGIGPCGCFERFEGT